MRVVVVDDTPDLRLLLRLTLERDGDVAVVAEAEDGRAGVEAVGREQPDLVMLDLAMPVMDGLEALPLMRRASPESRIVVLSGFEAGAMRDKALAAGADAYLQKGASPGEILDQVRTLTGDRRTAVPAARPPLQARSTDPAARDTVRHRHPDQVPAEVVARHAATGLLLVTGAGARVPRLAWANPAAGRLLGLGVAAVGRLLDDVAPGLAALVDRALPQLDEGTEGTAGTAGTAGAVGTTVVTDRLLVGDRPVEVSVARAEPEVPGAVAVTVVPARTSQEVDRLRQAIRTTAHEIRNPVTLLSGVAGVVAEAGASLTEQQQKHLLAAVGRQAAVLERVSEDLLTAAQAGRGALRVDLRETDLSPLVRHVVRDVAGSQPVDLALPDELWAVADRTRVEQVVANLLTNAFVHADGPYRVEGAPEQTAGRSWVRITVADRGAGVPASFLPRMYDEFSRADSTRQGTGLGLYVVRALAEAHGGRVDHADRPDGGSLFSVRLPAAAARPATDGGAQQVEAPDQTGRPDSL